MRNTDWAYGETAAAPDAGGDYPRAVGLTDATLAADHLRRGLADRRPVQACELLKLRYLPGRLLQAIYRVSSDGRADDFVTVVFLREGDASAAAAAGNVLPLPGWNALARVFPDDPALPRLGAMIDAAAVSARLAPAAGTTLAAEDMSWSLLSYQPGDRCALRYRWRGAAFDAVGKLQSGAAASDRAMRKLWNLPDRRFRMPEPLACDATLAVRWERFVAGERLEPLAAEHGLGRTLERVVRGLVDLHGTPLPDLPVQDRVRVLTRIEHKVLPRIRGALPAIAGRCEDFVGKLARTAADLPAAMPVTIHGDLHTGNILLDDDGLVLIDLDSLARGEPAFDLALLGTRLILIALLGDADMAETAQAVAGLPRIYAEAGGDEVPSPVFAWYVAALLVGRQLKTSINNLAPGVDALGKHLLARADAVLAAQKVEAVLLGGEA